MAFFLAAILLCLGLSVFFSYRYPLKYKETIEAHSSAYSVAPKVVAAVINVESGFDSSAVSNKGAVGLMQLLPSTAVWLGHKLGKTVQSDELFEPSINIQLGTYYIAYLVSYFKNIDLALCAYNAGMGNVKRWLTIEEYSVDGETLRKIPFTETENYLRKVKKNMKIYENKFI